MMMINSAELRASNSINDATAKLAASATVFHPDAYPILQETFAY